jgi:hypothetical protein
MNTVVWKDFLLWIIAGGGGGTAAWWLIGNIKWLKELAPDYKRYASWILSAGLPLAAWGIFLLMGYEPPPSTWQGWVERIFALIALAFSGSQILHGATDLRRRRQRMEAKS